MDESSEGLEASTTPAFNPSNQLISVSPQDLQFYTVATQPALRLTITNPTSNIIAYKIKTTAPKRYTVRPPLGYCPPNSVLDVTVALNVQHIPTEGHVDKFQIQSFVVDSDKQEPRQLWQTVDKKTTNIVKARFKASFKSGPVVDTSSTTSTVAPVNPAPPVISNVPVAEVIGTSHSPKSRKPNPPFSEVKPEIFIQKPDSIPSISSNAYNQKILYLAILVSMLVGFILGMYFEKLNNSSSTVQNKV